MIYRLKLLLLRETGFFPEIRLPTNNLKKLRMLEVE